MNATPHDPRPSTPDDEDPQDRPAPAADAGDGLADAQTAEEFQQAVEHRLSEPGPDEESGTEAQTAGTDDDDNPVSVDNPE
ncbi:hypothetical protein QYM41_14835 [Kocuria sp. CPCC 205268]|uniref:hypothetical protein n=1 Tax=Kocuria oxytropis TaxID=3058913 RepID=UPI0034D5D95F